MKTFEIITTQRIRTQLCRLLPLSVSTLEEDCAKLTVDKEINGKTMAKNAQWCKFKKITLSGRIFLYLLTST